MKVVERKVQEISGSLLVSLPKGWTRSVHLKKGSILRFIISPQGTITISPEVVKDEEKKESVIEYDEHILRRFFREYFMGNEEITIKLQKKISADEKKELYAFLKKFMNVQIIAETEQKIVLKSFKIEELSIEDCLNRMFYLTLNMLDERRAGNDELKLQELERNVKRFYYMLVMQIRRFIGEGKFAEQNQITLVRAMDCRMTGMKIDDIADIILASDSIKSESIQKMLDETVEFYKKAFLSFVSNDFDRALKLWSEEKALEKKYSALIENAMKKKNIGEYRQGCDLLQIMKLSRRISMLVR